MGKKLKYIDLVFPNGRSITKTRTERSELKMTDIPNTIYFYKDVESVGPIVTRGKIKVSLVSTVPNQTMWALVIDPLTGDQFQCVKPSNDREELLKLYLFIAQISGRI